MHWRLSSASSFGYRLPKNVVPPTGKTFAIDVIDICRFRDGRIVEHWGVPDRFSQFKQVGLIPEPRPAGFNRNAPQART